MAADRHPQAKAHKDGRKAENEKRDAGARDGRQPEVAVDSPKDDATASQGDGKCNRTPHRVGSFRLRSLPSLSLLGGRLATRPMLRILAELPRATCASLLEFDATHDVWKREAATSDPIAKAIRLSNDGAEYVQEEAKRHQRNSDHVSSPGSAVRRPSRSRSSTSVQ